MKKVFLGILLILILFSSSTTTYAATTQIKVDGVVIVSDVKPEIRNNRTMVPLRIISENLGAKVNWSETKITLTRNDMQVILNLNSNTALINGKGILLDAKPYIKNKRTMVPIRLIAETFSCNINYSNSTVAIDTDPLVIEGVQVKALQQEYHMTMGGVVSQIRGNAYIEEIYNVFVKNKGDKIDAPSDYTWSVHSITPGVYYKNGQYDFLDQEGNSIQQFDIYSVNQSFSVNGSEKTPKYLIYDATEDQWYLFNHTANQSIHQLIDTSSKNGFLMVISNTVA
ncbi:copper amine oxidase N-terminal domain-containing protein [Paenibacillus sp. CMAA1364]